MPLSSGHRKLGRLDLAGSIANGDEAYDVLSEVAELLESLQPAIARLAEELPIDTFGRARNDNSPRTKLDVEKDCVDITT